jgi:hypothetical protein
VIHVDRQNRYIANNADLNEDCATAADAEMPPKRCRGRPAEENRGSRNTADHDEGSVSGSSAQSLSSSDDPVAQHIAPANSMTGEALLCYTAGIAQRLVTKIAAIDCSDEPFKGQMDAAAHTADVAVVLERHYDCVADTIDQLHAVEQVVRHRLAVLEEEMHAPEHSKTDLRAIADRRGRGRRGRGRGK